MRVTLLTIVLTVLAKTAFSSPISLSADLPDLQSILLQEVTKSNLTDIISEIIGLDIVSFNDQVKIAALELLQIVSTANDRYENISAEASPEFKGEISEIILKTIGRFSSLFERVFNAVESLPQNSSLIVIKDSVLKAIGRIEELKENDQIAKEAVVAIIDELLDTSFTSTIRDELRHTKVILEVLFIIDEANVAVSTVIAKEKPEFSEKIRALVIEIEYSVMTALRPLIDMLRPLFLSDLNVGKSAPL